MAAILGLLPLVLVLVVMADSVSGRFVVEKNSLTVTSPSSMKGTYDSAIANFGIPQYGGSLAGAVVYPKKDNANGCEEFSSGTFKAKPGSIPNFLLLDRGGKFWRLVSWFLFFLLTLILNVGIANFEICVWCEYSILEFVRFSEIICL